MADLPKGIIKRGEKYRVSTMVRGARKTATCSTLEIATQTLEQFKLGLLEQAKEQHKTWTLAQAWDAYVDYRLAKTTAKLTVNEKKSSGMARCSSSSLGLTFSG